MKTPHDGFRRDATILTCRKSLIITVRSFCCFPNLEYDYVGPDDLVRFIEAFVVCDGSVFPAVGGVNPALTIQTIAMRTASRIGILAQRGEL